MLISTYYIDFKSIPFLQKPTFSGKKGKLKITYTSLFFSSLTFPKVALHYQVNNTVISILPSSIWRWPWGAILRAQLYYKAFIILHTRLFPIILYFRTQVKYLSPLNCHRNLANIWKIIFVYNPILLKKIYSIRISMIRLFLLSLPLLLQFGRNSINNVLVKSWLSELCITLQLKCENQKNRH